MRRTMRRAAPSARARQNCVLWLFRWCSAVRSARESVATLGLPRGAGGRALYGYHSFDATGCLSKARGKGSEMLLCVWRRAARPPTRAVDLPGRGRGDGVPAGQRSPRRHRQASRVRPRHQKRITEHNNLELEPHGSFSTEEPYIRFNCVVAPRIQIHLIEIRLVARRLHRIQIILKIRRHSE